MKRVIGLLACTLLMAGCDSGTNLVATPAVTTPLTANAALSTVTQGSTSFMLLTVPQSAFPAELLSGPSVAVVLGATSVPGTAMTVSGTPALGFVVPATSPLTLDTVGRTKVLFTAGSTVRMAELTVTRI